MAHLGAVEAHPWNAEFQPGAVDAHHGTVRTESPWSHDIYPATVKADPIEPWRLTLES